MVLYYLNVSKLMYMCNCIYTLIDRITAHGNLTDRHHQYYLGSFLNLFKVPDFLVSWTCLLQLAIGLAFELKK